MTKVTSNHTHTLSFRVSIDGEIRLIEFFRETHTTDQPRRELVRMSDDIIQNPDTYVGIPADAVLYKVDGEIEYFISKYFFDYPNPAEDEVSPGVFRRKRRPPRKQAVTQAA